MDEKNFTIEEWSKSGSKEMDIIKNIISKPVVQLQQKEITEKDVQQYNATDKKPSFKDILGIL